MTRSRTSPTCGLILLAVTLACWAPAAIGEETDEELRKHWKIEKFQWQGPLGESSGLDILNELGDVRTRLSNDREVYVSAVIQRHEADPHQADVRIGEKDGKMTIETVFAAAESFDPEILTPGMARRRIDLTVIVPLGARLDVRTVKGLIEAKGLESDVTATSVSGDVVVSILGSLEARTERGEITATFKSTEWQAPPALETLTGDIHLWLPQDADVTVRAETTGLITTDYSIRIESEPAPSEQKAATARIGQGKGRLSIHSTKGSVRILRRRG